MKTNTKTLAVSLSLLASANVLAGMGGLNVQSNLGEPFSGSITVTGKEAEALLQSRSVNVSGNGISGTVVPQGNGTAVIRLRSGSAVNEPVLNFVVKAGNQTRQYTAMINPARYAPKGAVRTKVPVVSQPSYTAMDNDLSDVIQDDEDKPVRKARAQRQRVAPMARSSNAHYHRVQSGETLAQIAARYRPHNMSQQRAMRAIMAANPRAFRRGTNGNIMYDGSTLYIPTGSQFKGYANSKKRHAQRRLSGRRYVAPAVVVAPVAEPQVAPQPVAPAVTPTPTPATPVAPQTPPPVAKVPSAPPAAQEPVKNEEAPAPASVVVTSKPASAVAVPAAPSAPVVASAPVASTVAPVVASQPVAASAASIPTESASAASAVVASAPVKPQRPKPVSQPEPEPETDWLPLALGGAAGLALLGGAGYFLSRRRKAAEEGEDLAADDEFVVVDDDEFVVEETTTVSPAVAAAQRVNLGKQVDEPVFNDQDDNVFFGDTVTVATKPAADEFDLNSFEPDDTFEVRSADVQESEEEWDWLNSDDSNIDSTVDESNWDSGKTAAVATAAVATTAVAASQRNTTPEFDASEFDVASTVVENETSSDDDWLNEIFTADEAPAVVEQTVVESDDLVFEDFNTVSEPAPVVAAEPEVESSDFDLDFDVAAPAAIATAATVAAVAPSQEDDLSFDLSDDLNLPESEVVVTPAVETVDDLSFDLPAEPETNVSFDLDEIETPTPDSFDLSSEEPADFNLDLPAEETATDFNLDLPSDDFAVDTSADSADLDLNVAEPALDSFETDLAISSDDDALSFAAEEPSLPADDLAFADEEVNAAELDSLNSLRDLDVSFDEPAVAETASLDSLSLDDTPVAAPEPVAEDLSWMNEAPAEAAVAHNEANAAGFVSEAVGMAAPQEAKLELAKMYLEIDDAVAARETLRELIGESHGELQQQAKDLLAELGG
ncbi:FimV/HubP family polar landmark protein [Neisseriaceae bacterium B1]